MRESKSKDALPFTCATDTITSIGWLYKGYKNSELQICTEPDFFCTCVILIFFSQEMHRFWNWKWKKSIWFASIELFITKQTKGNKVNNQHIICHFSSNFLFTSIKSKRQWNSAPKLEQKTIFLHCNLWMVFFSV